MIGGKQIVQAFGGFGGRDAFGDGGGRGSLAEFSPDHREALRVVLGGIMRDSAGAGVQRRAAERFRIHYLADRAFHKVRSAEPHEAGAFDHDDDVGQRG